MEGHPYGPEPGEEDVVEVSNTNPVVAASNKGKKRPAGTTTPSVGKYFKPSLDQGINQHLRVFFKEKRSKRRQICV